MDTFCTLRNLAVCLCFLAGPSFGQVLVSTEQKLTKKLFTDSNYDKEIFPSKTANDTLKVSLGLAVISLIDVDEKNQALVVNGWVRMKWNDYRLRWDPAAYDGISLLRVSDQRVWRPDIFLYNNAKSAYTYADQQVNVIVYSDGHIIWIPPKQIMSHCAMDMRKFPFDQHMCHLAFGSWSFDGNRLDLENFGKDYTIDLADFAPHDEWDIIRNTGARSDKFYACCEEPYPEITYNITISRKSSYYSQIFIGPAVVMTLLIPFIFLLPPESGEKVTLGVGIMICLVLMVLMMEGFLPSALSTAPIIAMYYTSSFILMGISVAFSVRTLGMYWHGSNSSPPALLSKVFVDGLGRCLCVKRDNYSGVSNDEGRGDSDIEVKSPKTGHGRKEWRLISIVVDRLLWIIFMVVAIIMTIALFV
ncbi:neuronal acetylcholine receptor subunit alpha-7-like [Lineus longissimus]|uniref:neuronal acetylcholine receptor subunit alpha-7-like n=1 Tax=Lineus longissimus TaxID=88925 RepID=UPI002B4DB7B3